MNPTSDDEGQKQPLQVFYKKGALKISQNSQEKIYVGVTFLINL